jgi:PadR family transcriptional regulator AphA
MSLTHALLGVLSAGPMSGYDLLRQFRGSAGWLWSASNGQLYPELRRMEDQGLIRGDIDIRGRKLEKRIYSITEAGADELLRWVEEPFDTRTSRDAVSLKATFLDMGDNTAAREHFAAHRDAMQKRLLEIEGWIDVIERREHPLIRLRLAHLARPAQDRMVTLKVHGFRRLAALTEAEIRWAEEGLELLDGVTPKKAYVTKVTGYR